MSNTSYWMTARWGARVDPLSVLAERFNRTVDAIQAVHPSLEAWEWGDAQEIRDTEGEGGNYPFAEVRKKLIPAIGRNAGTEDDGKPNPLNGFWMAAMIDGMTSDCKASLSVSANKGYKGGNGVSAFMNKASFELGKTCDPSLVTYDAWRSIFLLINETWEATWAEASPEDIRPYWTGIPVRCAWMSYVSPYFAPQITPPPSVIVEHRPNGGLFLAATRDLFRTDNAAHLAAAREIEAALQPLNRIPNPNDAPYRRATSQA